MLLPNISSLKKLVNNFFPGGPGGSEDFVQLIRQSDGTVLGWVDEGGVPRGSLAPPAASPLVAPPFFSCYDLLGIPTTAMPSQYSLSNGTWISGIHDGSGETSWGFLTSGNGAINGFPFYLPFQLTTSNIYTYVVNSDSTNQYDIGIYGPYAYASGFVTVPLACHTGPKSYFTEGNFSYQWTSPATLEPGYYVLMFTTAGTSNLSLAMSGSGGNDGFGVGSLQFVPVINGVQGSSVNSTLPNSIAVSLEVEEMTVLAAQVNFTLF